MSDKLIVCSKWAGVNRIPQGRSASDAKCGKCGAKLFEGHAEDVGKDVFDKQVARSGGPVLVDVWAPWCGPCRMMAPAYEAAAKQLEPDVRLIKLNSDEEQAVSAKLGIRGIPTMLLFDGGREVARTSGAMTTSQIVQWVRSQLSSSSAA